jgi:hypothetical protein
MYRWSFVMVLFETINPYNNVVSYINPEYIMDIGDYRDSVNKVYAGSKIHVQGAMITTYYDYRTPQEIAEAINKLYGR